MTFSLRHFISHCPLSTEVLSHFGSQHSLPLFKYQRLLKPHVKSTDPKVTRALRRRPCLLEDGLGHPQLAVTGPGPRVWMVSTSCPTPLADFSSFSGFGCCCYCYKKCYFLMAEVVSVCLTRCEKRRDWLKECILITVVIRRLSSWVVLKMVSILWVPHYHMLWFHCSIVSDSLQSPWTTACQASLSFTISWSLLNLMSMMCS